MIAAPERILLCVRRRVNQRRREPYDAAWTRLHAAVTGQGAHAWRFVGRENPGIFLEFLEFASGADPRRESEVRAALAALDTEHPHRAAASAAPEEWLEIPAGNPTQAPAA